MVCFSEDRIMGGLKYVMLVIGPFWFYGTLSSLCVCVCEREREREREREGLR